jgi:acyl carrier protein
MKDVILKIIYLCVDEINVDLETDGKLEKNELEEIFSADSKLDSMGLVNFVVSIEEKIQEHFNLDVTLADDKAMSQSRSPFRTIGSLADYIENIVNKA